ncbi:MAG: recombinase family protein [Alphaproteobacteria bacterium]
MLIGYARVSKADGSQSLDLQSDALIKAGVTEDHIYSDVASGKKDERAGLLTCLKALRTDDVLVVWKLRLGRSLKHLVKTVSDLSDQGVGLKVLAGAGAQVRLAQSSMAKRDTSVPELCKELGIQPVTLYRYVDPNGNLREYGQRVLAS